MIPGPLGKYGFSYTPQLTSFAGVATSPRQEMLRTDPTDLELRRWVINLAAMKFSSGTVPAGVLPPDNTIDTAPRYQAIVEWGGGGAGDNAVVDWPARGCAFAVHGDTVKLSSQAAGGILVGGGVPLLAAWMAPVERQSLAVQSPTFTTAQFALAAGVPVLQPVPARGTAYRVFVWSPPSGPTPLAVLQLEQFGGGYNALDSITTAAQGLNRTGASDYFPLIPESQAVKLTASVAGIAQVVVQFLLDLG